MPGMPRYANPKEIIILKKSTERVREERWFVWADHKFCSIGITQING